MRSFSTVVLLVAVAFGHAHAAPENPTRSLTLDEALLQAERESRDIKATREHLVQSRTDIDRAYAAMLPVVATQLKYTVNNKEIDVSFAPSPTPGSLSAASNKLNTDTITDLYNGRAPSAQVVSDAAALASYCTNNPSSSDCLPVVIQQQNQLDFFLSVNVPLFVPSAWYGVRSAKRAFAAQEASAASTVAQLLVSVAVAFYAAAGNDELVVAREHGVKVAKETLDNARARLDAGVSNRVDVTRAEQAVVRAEQALKEANATASASYRSLATLLQIREPFRAIAADEPAPVSESDNDLVSEGRRLRPELRVYRLQIDAADATVLSAKLKWAPTVSGFGILRAFSAAGFSGDHYSWGLGLQLDWQLYDGGLRQAQQRQSESVIRESELRRAQLADQIADEVAIARETLDVKRSAIDAARREVSLADETLKLVRVQRDAGTATQLDLLNAQDALVQAEVSVARARFDIGLAYIQLRRAAGQFPSK